MVALPGKPKSLYITKTGLPMGGAGRYGGLREYNKLSLIVAACSVQEISLVHI